ncbi:type II toxin-antitoxin system VapC family toxin [Rhodoferax sp. OV413]|uniref:type II toxin-antitoxin system VapC family toxin n=1 Tax=Rhodoferax sp. OV413 TaxID=1855285 RepID=UPI0025DD0C02|nr:type II toxin-antitoxin system VapC family toxin [Rhodoferax sp. OV413]
MNQRYMLDTNVVSHIMQGRDAPLLARLGALVVGQVVISSVTLAELEYGIHRKAGAAGLRNALTQLLQRVDVLPWDEKVATVYGELCATLESQGINLSDFDMMIAAHAIATGATLVSRDKAFQQVPQHRLQLQVW